MLETQKMVLVADVTFVVVVLLFVTIDHHNQHTLKGEKQKKVNTEHTEMGSVLGTLMQIAPLEQGAFCLCARCFD